MLPRIGLVLDLNCRQDVPLNSNANKGKPGILYLRMRCVAYSWPSEYA